MVTITGRITYVSPLKTGEKDGKVWKSQDYVLEYKDNEYQRHIVFNVFNKIDEFGLAVGKLASVMLDLDAHEWNGKWYNQIRCIGVANTQPSHAPSAPATPKYASEPPVQNTRVEKESEAVAKSPSSSDLPF